MLYYYSLIEYHTKHLLKRMNKLYHNGCVKRNEGVEYAPHKQQKMIPVPLKDPEKRKEYERERKNRKRIEQYMKLPEPERSLRLEANARRRQYKMRWTSDKVRMRNR